MRGAADAAGGGPRFVTKDGRYGLLVPRGDTGKLVEAMTLMLQPVAADAAVVATPVIPSTVSRLSRPRAVTRRSSRPPEAAARGPGPDVVVLVGAVVTVFLRRRRRIGGRDGT